MQSSTWNVVFSSNDAGSYAWGTGRADHFLTLHACMYLVVGSDSAVYMVVVPADNARDVLIFDFGQFWSDASLYRWTEDVVTYHAERTGLVLVLEKRSDMERFEQACDLVLSTCKAGRVPPTLEQLGELGILPVPRRVGGFLHGDLVTEPAADENKRGSVDAGTTDSRRDMGGLGTYLDAVAEEIDFDQEDLDKISFEELSAMISEAEAIMSEPTS